MIWTGISPVEGMFFRQTVPGPEGSLGVLSGSRKIEEEDDDEEKNASYRVQNLDGPRPALPGTTSILPRHN